MITFNKYFNSKGLTLVELLASIVLLGIVITTFFSFFSQSMMFSSKVEDKFSAVNIAEKVLYDTKIHYINIKEEDKSNKSCYKISIPSKKLSGQDIGRSDDTYPVNNKEYYPGILISQTEDERSLCLYRVYVAIYDNSDPDNRILLSEIFDYINLRKIPESD